MLSSTLLWLTITPKCWATPLLWGPLWGTLKLLWLWNVTTQGDTSQENACIIHRGNFRTIFKKKLWFNWKWIKKCRMCTFYLHMHLNVISYFLLFPRKAIIRWILYRSILFIVTGKLESKTECGCQQVAWHGQTNIYTYIHIIIQSIFLENIYVCAGCGRKLGCPERTQASTWTQELLTALQTCEPHGPPSSWKYFFVQSS